MTDEQNKKKDRLFGDISVIQVTATAAAAVTSMLLASYIGIAGSVIGTAVASVVSTVAASAYKKFMRDSAEKIKELPLPAISDGRGKSHGAASSVKTKDAADADKGAEGTTSAPEATGGDMAKEEIVENASDKAEKATENPDSPAAEEDAALAQEADATALIAHQKRLQRGLIAVCVVSALLAVAASGAVVYLLTTGEGLGAKPSVVYVNSSSDSSSQSARPNMSEAQSSSEAAQSEQKEQSDAATSPRDWFIPWANSSSSSSSSSSSNSSFSSSASSSSSSVSSSPASSTPSLEKPEADDGDESLSHDGDSSTSDETAEANSAETDPAA